MTKIKNTTSLMFNTKTSPISIIAFEEGNKHRVIAAGVLTDGKYGYSFCEEQYIRDQSGNYYLYLNEQAFATASTPKSYAEFLQRVRDIIASENAQ